MKVNYMAQARRVTRSYVDVGSERDNQTAQLESATSESATRANSRKQARVRFGVIGYGYWGPQLVRNLDRLTLGEVCYIADSFAERRERARLEFPSVTIVENAEEVFNSDVHAVVIATPIRTHFELARAALLKGKDVFVEKPLAATVSEASALVTLAEELGRVLMVGHTFMYNPAVEELRRLVQSGALGSVYYVDAVRVNLGLFQRDINVMWDLAPHDLSILNYILEMQPDAVSAHGGAYVRQDIHDVVYLTLRYPGGLLAHIQVSWLHPSKIRQFTVVGDKQMVVYDDVQPTEKIRVFNRGVDAPSHTSTFGEFQLSYRYGDIVSPHVRWSEPLAVECGHFAEAILERKTPRSDGRDGLSIVRILEAADQSLASGGVFVAIPQSESGELASLSETD